MRLLTSYDFSQFLSSQSTCISQGKSVETTEVEEKRYISGNSNPHVG